MKTESDLVFEVFQVFEVFEVFVFFREAKPPEVPASFSPCLFHRRPASPQTSAAQVRPRILQIGSSLRLKREPLSVPGPGSASCLSHERPVEG